MEYLYEHLEATVEEYEYYVEVSFVEIYNETIRDLLNDDFPACPRGGLKLLENEKERVRIDRVTLKRPTSVQEVMELVMLGNQRRSTSFTHSNSESSRSHAVLQVNVGRNNRNNEVDFEEAIVRNNVTSATLSIIDLAGSERASATRNNGARMKEGANINRSLLALSSCISALCQRPTRGVKVHVPYRDSKLTRMLKFSLGGNCRTVMIVCVSPSSRDIEDTHNTLIWADRAKNVSTKISKNTEGVTVRVQQYLDKIFAQEEKIRALETAITSQGKAAETPAQVQKREKAQREAAQALDDIGAQIEDAGAAIADGAEKRALWDVSELMVGSLLRRVEDLNIDPGNRSTAAVQREKDYFNSLIRKETSSYRDNSKVSYVVQLEMGKTKSIDSQIRNTAERTYDGALSEAELAKNRVALDLKRCEVDKNVAASREKAYRRMNRQLADTLTASASTLSYLRSHLEVLAESVGSLNSPNSHDLADQLKALGAICDTKLSTMFGNSTPSADDLPPLPSFSNVQRIIFPSPAPERKMAPPPLPLAALSAAPSRNAFPAPVSALFTAPSRSSNHDTSAANLSLSMFGETSMSSMTFKNPLVRRLAVTKAAASPRRRVAQSPAKKRILRPAISSASKLSTSMTAQPAAVAKKGVVWKSDNSIIEERTMSDAASQSSPDNVQNAESSDASSDWLDISPKPKAPAPIKALGQPSRRLSQLPQAIGSATRSSPPANIAPANDWRAARMRPLPSTKPPALNTVSEENSVDSGSPSSRVPVAVSKPGLMGPPQRAATKTLPLGERHHQLPTSSSTGSASSGDLPSSNSGSTLHKPTAASAARAVNPDSSILSNAPSRHGSRRESSIGPVRLRQSHGGRPYDYDRPSGPRASLSVPSSSAAGTGTISGLPNMSVLSGPSRRLSTLNLRDESRKVVSVPLESVGEGAAKNSPKTGSASTLPRNFARASMSRFGTGTFGSGNPGDSSVSLFQSSMGGGAGAGPLASRPSMSSLRAVGPVWK